MKKKIFISSVTEHFQPNSSSTHSFTFKKSNISMQTYHDSKIFGWENFVLADKLSKYKYLYCLYKNRIEFQLRIIPEKFKKIISEHFFAVNPNLEVKKIEGCEEGLIDHQSRCGYLPLNFKGEINFEFLEYLLELCDNENFIILGGNDNSEGHPLIEGCSEKEQNFNNRGFRLVCKTSDLPSNSVIRKDTNKDGQEFWTQFETHFGKRTIFYFSEDERKIEKSEKPMLVDLKITNYCTFGCNFCYQKSKKKGKHAEIDKIKKVSGRSVFR